MTSMELQLQPEWEELQLSPSAIIRKTERFAPYALGLVVLAFIIGYALGPLRKDGGFLYSLGSDVTATIPALPVVEPLVLKQVDKSLAKKVNDRTPMTSAPVLPAAPFIHTGGSESLARATDCLAANIFYEAGAEDVNGQMAVVQVVLNRMRHPAYPKTVCGVVFQGQERRTGCQFSFSCDGSIARRLPSAVAWQRAQGIARAMLNGLVYAPVGLATHYHTDWVLPAWSAKLDKVRVERTHLFFRYNGYWGTPQAYRGRYTGVEPEIAKLAALSPAHRGSEDPAAIPTLLATETEAPDEAVELARAMPERVSESVTTADKSKDTFIIYVDPLLDGDSLKQLGDRACGTRSHCKVLAWTDYTLMPKGLPLEGGERASMAFSYLRDKGVGSKARWNCALFPRAHSNQCLPGTAGKALG
jgi:hypothetical protein